MQAATLTINLAAIIANYRLLTEKHAAKNCAAVVKANAYGLGVTPVSQALWNTGCREFFVATLAEGIELRATLPEAHIGVFQGMFAGEEKGYAEHRLIPVVNSLEQLEWVQRSGVGGQGFILHVDTGMTRLGLNSSELHSLPPDLRPLSLMSHLACANEPAHEKNAEQLSRFQKAAALFPNARKSLANSSGIFLPPEFHFDIARPGCALYGINPTSGKNPMQHVATLDAPILQIRTLDRDETIGYGATASLPKNSRIAIAGIGYADGYFRHLSNKAFAYVAGHKVPLIGRVSMDMVALDVSTVPHPLLTSHVRAEFINAQQTVDDVADAAGTIGYEIFTRIGARVVRDYV
jgi:alanine racemase